MSDSGSDEISVLSKKEPVLDVKAVESVLRLLEDLGDRDMCFLLFERILRKYKNQPVGLELKAIGAKVRSLSSSSELSGNDSFDTNHRPALTPRKHKPFGNRSLAERLENAIPDDQLPIPSKKRRKK